MVRPGVQLQYNIQNSPFYLALGWQTGAKYREKDGEEFALRATSRSLSFGIDVPIRTLYVR